MFTVEYRTRVRTKLLDMARADPRLIAGAEVGSMALGKGDRWSDLDLTLGLAPDTEVGDILADWTRRLEHEFDAVHLFDLPFLSTVYRVLLFPGNLQVDLSFTPGAEFGALGPKFTLLFGKAVDRDHVPPPSSRQIFGLGVHHAVRARICVERGRWWEAEYLISGVRDEALSLACRRRGLPARYGRGYDDLPAEVRGSFHDALVRSIDRDELLRALGAAIDALLRESDEVRELASKVEADLRQLVSIDWPES